jgi:ABC-type Fe3+-hydroxamate transport system substrate-binding protein
LTSLKPDVILTQDLCNVCAIDLPSVNRLASKMNPQPKVVTLNPVKLEDVLEDLVTVGEAVGLQEGAMEAKRQLEARVQAVKDVGDAELAKVGGVRPKVLFMEWTDPIYPAGHW